MKHLLEQAGYEYTPETGVWTHPGFAGIAYSDGDEVEQRLARLIAQATDLQVLSDELKQHITDWPSLYHLSSSRANILRPFEKRLAGVDVLEIGAGCGAITRYLGESGARVLALEGSARRAAIARSRTRDLPQVEVLAERFDQFSSDAQFDVITLIGVLEYANQFVPGPAPALTMLQRARALLKPGGLLLVAIENQLGLKYWAGAPEDHLGVPMYGIEGRYRADQPQTHGRAQLAQLLAAAGFARSDFLSPVPDYKLPVSVLTPSGMACAEFDASALAAQSARRDPQLPASPSFALELAWPAVMQNGLGADLANSFLIAATDSDVAVLDATVLAYHYSTERMRDFCKQTVFRRAPDGAVRVHCHLLAPASTAVPGQLLTLQLMPETAYIKGQTLATELVAVVVQDGWSIDAVGAFLKRHLEIIGPLAMGGRPFPVPTSAHAQLPGICFDLVPQNIIHDPQGHYHAIDLEWTLRQGMPVGWLLFRTLLLLVQSVTRFGAPGSAFVTTRRGFFLAALRSAGFNVNAQVLESFALMEATAQAEATGQPVASRTNWWADSPLPMQVRGVGITHEVRELEVQVQSANALIEAYQNQQQQSDALLATLQAKVAEQHAQFVQLEQLGQAANAQTAERDQHIVVLQAALQDMRASRSWRVSGPLRAASTMARTLRRRARSLPDAIKVGGGVIPTLRTTVKVLRSEGVRGVRSRLANVPARLMRIAPAAEVAAVRTATLHRGAPYYPNPLWDKEPPITPQEGARFAVHCHLRRPQDADALLQRLRVIPVPFDLYVSVAGGTDGQGLHNACKQSLPRVGHVQIEDLPVAAQPLTALLACFGQALTAYSAFAHFDVGGAASLQAAQSLTGPQGSSGGRLPRLLALLEDSVALVLASAASDTELSHARAAQPDWVERVARACGLQLDPALTHWPLAGTSAFVLRGSCLKGALPMVALLHQDGAGAAREALLSDAVAALLPVLACACEARVLQIQQGDSIEDFRDYEGQRDYADAIVHGDVKVLSYYLPQFHPTPENDEWHGKGFTEWTKVSAANPLFEGHYQQHIPHPDIGYYLLDSPDTLRLQAEQMRQAGVHGQVFYHYWFSGRMILEKPAQMLLAHPDVAMPFCFCWANENWTRRWDGNEREILLGQTYSADDARAFIRYLIPFFRDPRYIRVGQRPVLMVYRPSSMPDPAQYLRIWAEECAQAGLDAAPYVVAVLTRGATHPADFHMDAGLERPLHDWTDGAVPDMRASLQPYWPMNGSALSYDQVRDFYMAQNERKSFDYFRSNAPMWDNTARYGTEALLLHGSTPASFQRWMEHSIADAQTHLPPDRRFVVVNAWNEWAEGTHLEPDTRYGYSYLNSVGRALSGLPYAHAFNADAVLPEGLRLELYFAPELTAQLGADAELRSRFFHCLKQSRILLDGAVCVDYFDHTEALPLARVDAASACGDLRIDFRRAVQFAPDVIANMVQTAVVTRARIICNDYGHRLGARSILANGAVDPSEADAASLLVRPSVVADSIARECRMRSDAWCFELHPHTAARQDLPRVTTILRFHKRGSLEELMRAISCLYVMQDCTVVPLIAAQDLDAAQLADLTQMLQTFDWPQGCEPIVDQYASLDGRGDLRSVMLTESLLKVTTQYAAFLDYDDLLFSDAYAWLIQRLRSTGKAVAFGRVYWTACRSQWHALMERRKAFQYGGTYQEFVHQNHAPLHSILLDVQQIDRSKLIYFDDQRFMEDYLMTLQIFRESNSDWEGLSQNHYVGDYIHSIDRAHTLALTDEQTRLGLLNDPEYMICEQRIQEMRKKVLNR